MYEKALIVIIFMYCASFSLLAAQYLWADVIGLVLRNSQGVELRSNVLSIIDTGQLNQVTLNIVNARSQENDTFGPVDNAFLVGYYVGWELIQILTGTYIFNLLLLLGIPDLLIVPLVAIYAILLARAIIAYIRGL